MSDISNTQRHGLANAQAAYVALITCNFLWKYRVQDFSFLYLLFATHSQVWEKILQRMCIPKTFCKYERPQSYSSRLRLEYACNRFKIDMVMFDIAKSSLDLLSGVRIVSRMQTPQTRLKRSQNYLQFSVGHINF